jgi:leucyl aminopeptidase
MIPELTLSAPLQASTIRIFLVTELQQLPLSEFDAELRLFVGAQLFENNKDKVVIDYPSPAKIVIKKPESEIETHIRHEKLRKTAESIIAVLSDYKAESISIIDLQPSATDTLAFTEGLLLGNYQFLKHKSNAEEKQNPLKQINITCNSIDIHQLKELSIIAQAVYHSRNLVNEPASSLTATNLADAFCGMVDGLQVKVEILNKQKIQALKMGGLLAVNQGSIEPPTFSILEYKPENALNKQPIVLVGKGVVYDTGGMSLKPSAAMVDMKSDMAGSAVVVSVIYALAALQLPVYVIALAPATDNRPDGNACVPGDVITMMDGTTVEVLNTDAEGRLLLADALVYAGNYDPMLVIDVATLTGAAEAAVGQYGIVAMQNRADNYMLQLSECGNEVYERIAQFPFWDEYAELIKSEVADLKNVGGRFAGAITAGKFLQHFTSYPWIHLDIAGTAFLEKKDSYRGSGATGSGVRLLYSFIKSITEK